MLHRRIAAASLGIATAAAGIAVAVTTSPAAATSSPAAASAKTHTLRFKDKQAGKNIDKGPLLIQADDDYDGKKLIGTDNISCTFGKTAARCYVSLAIKGGLLYGKFTESPDDSITGTITGGAGDFKGAAGTIHSTKHSAITVKYRY